MDSDLPLLCRAAREVDQGYVTSTWALYLCAARTHCNGVHFRDGSNKPQSCDDSRALVDRALDSKVVKLAIGADPADSDVILGWLAYTSTPAARIIHGAYARRYIRNRRVAGRLMEYAGLNDKRPLLYTLPGPSARALLLKERFAPARPLPLEDIAP